MLKALTVSRLFSPISLQIVVLTIYSYAAREYMGFNKVELPIYWLVFSAVFLDFVIGTTFFKKKKFPASAVVVALASSILIESAHFWVYVLAVLCSLGSKSLLTVNGRHFFNPANFGAVCILLFLPDYATSSPQMFAYNSAWYYVFLSAGLFVSFRANQLMSSVGWMVGFLVFAWTRSGLSESLFLVNVAAIFSPTWLLFSFHMMTDPATAPRRASQQLAYGGVIALLDAIPRFFFLPNTMFFALFVYGACRLLFSYVSKMRTEGAELRHQMGAISVFAFALIGMNMAFYGGGFRVPGQKLFFWDEVPDRFPLDNTRKLEEISGQLGINFVHKNPIVHESLQAHLPLNYPAPGVAVEDFNNDGWLDFFVPSGQLSYEQGLFINNRGNGFRNEYLKWFASVEREGSLAILTPVLIDANRDGFIDLFLNGYGCPRFFINNNGQNFEDKTKQYLGDKCEHFGASAVFDFNRDGFMDLYVGREVPTDVDLHRGKNLERWTPDNPIDSRSGERNLILINNEGKSFRRYQDPSDTFGRWSADVAITDVDGDDELDLVVANDWGRDEYFHIKKDKLVRWHGERYHADRGNGMNASFYWSASSVDANPLVYISNNWLPGHKQIGNYAWQYDRKKRRLVDLSYLKGIHQCGWAWAATFADFNNDSWQELYVANGFVSRKKRESPLVNYKNEFLAGVFLSMAPVGLETDSLVDRTAKIVFPDDVDLSFDFLDLDPDANFAGYQRDCFFFNKGGDSFEEISAAAGIRDFSDSRGVIAADFTNTGKLDMVVSVQSDRTRYYRNHFEMRGHFLSIELVDRFGNRLVTGAEISLKGRVTAQRQISEGGKKSFFSYSGTRMHFGLGADKRVNVRITWPSGKTQEWPNIEANHHYKFKESGGWSRIW